MKITKVEAYKNQQKIAKKTYAQLIELIDENVQNQELKTKIYSWAKRTYDEAHMEGMLYGKI